MDETAECVVTLLSSAYEAGRSLALIFDYDGTLAPLTSHPCLASLPAGVREVLAELAALPRVVVGVISGRALADLKAMIGLPGLCYAGTNGLEVEIDDALIEHPKAMKFRERVDRLEESLQAAIASSPGAWIDRKPAGLTVHFRSVAAEQILDLCHAVRCVLGADAGAWHVVDGPMAIEITPAEGWKKDRALRSICVRGGPDVVPFYAGDHMNDEEALEAAAAMGGITVGVGTAAPAAARFRLPNPAALADVMSRIAAALRKMSKP